MSLAAARAARDPVRCSPSAALAALPAGAARGRSPLATDLLDWSERFAAGMVRDAWGGAAGLPAAGERVGLRVADVAAVTLHLDAEVRAGQVLGRGSAVVTDRRVVLLADGRGETVRDDRDPPAGHPGGHAADPAAQLADEPVVAPAVDLAPDLGEVDDRGTARSPHGLHAAASTAVPTVLATWWWVDMEDAGLLPAGHGVALLPRDGVGLGEPCVLALVPAAVAVGRALRRGSAVSWVHAWTKVLACWRAAHDDLGGWRAELLTALEPAGPVPGGGPQAPPPAAAFG